MKKTILSILLTLVLILAGCGKENDLQTINIGTAFYPMKDILLLIEEDLKNEGYELNIIDTNNEYPSLNNALKRGELDANMIQHEYYMQAFNQENNADFVVVLPIYHATFALYSKEYTSLDEIPNGATITLPNDSTNLGRALHLLKEAGLITLKENSGAFLTLEDVESNPKNLNLEDLVALPNLSNRYKETGLAVMYPTYARNLNLEGNAERLYVEPLNERTANYAISLVSRTDNKDSDKINVLIKYLNTNKVREFLIENYSWAATPAVGN